MPERLLTWVLWHSRHSFGPATTFPSCLLCRPAGRTTCRLRVRSEL